MSRSEKSGGASNRKVFGAVSILSFVNIISHVYTLVLWLFLWLLEWLMWWLIKWSCLVLWYCFHRFLIMSYNNIAYGELLSILFTVVGVCIAWGGVGHTRKVLKCQCLLSSLPVPSKLLVLLLLPLPTTTMFDFHNTNLVKI